jgi:protein tyrosine/serine phosphatase
MRDRVMPLSGVLNFRDFGGYATADGGHVRSRLLFRSAHFAEATPDDQAALDALNVHVVADLRRPEERSAEPNRWPGPGVTVLTNDLGLEAPPPHEAVATGNDWSVANVDQYMVHAYATYPYEPRYIDLFSGFLTRLVQDDRAAVIHCAAGKDRTGSLAALTLRLLGVPEEAVIQDYLLTNQVSNLEKRLPLMRQRISARYNSHPTDEALMRMMGVQEAYLQAYFGAIHSRFGRLEDYTAEVLGVGPGVQAALRGKFIAG